MNRAIAKFHAEMCNLALPNIRLAAADSFSQSALRRAQGLEPVEMAIRSEPDGQYRQSAIVTATDDRLKRPVAKI